MATRQAAIPVVEALLAVVVRAVVPLAVVVRAVVPLAEVVRVVVPLAEVVRAAHRIHNTQKPLRLEGLFLFEQTVICSRISTRSAFLASAVHTSGASILKYHRAFVFTQCQHFISKFPNFPLCPITASEREEMA